MSAPFPKEFLWGAATASYQVEGGIENCDWAEAAREGTVPMCGLACDHYGRFEADFDLVQELGHNAHRLSVEWARIEPRPGEFDRAAIDHYRAVLSALKERGLTPSLTLWHFTVPVWFSERGGWEHPRAATNFARYAAYVVGELGDLVSQVATVNEPMVVAGIGYVRGAWPPHRKHAYWSYLKALKHMIDGHNDAYRRIKERSPECSVGIVKHTVVYDHSGGNPLHRIRAWVQNVAWTRVFMHFVHKQCDWIGVNFYQRHVFGDTRELSYTDFHWPIDPLEGTYGALALMARYRKPLYVTEAGCADAADRFRGDYIRDTVRGIERALRDGIDVRGLFYWSLLDNYEWAEGFDKRFGIVEVNFETQERTIRPSAYVYRDLIREHGTHQIHEVRPRK